MEIVLKNSKSRYLEIFSLLDLDNLDENFKRFSSIKEPLEAKIFAVNESISCDQLSKLKNHFDKINICSLCIYSNNRKTIISARSLKIDSVFIKEQEIKNKLLLLNSKKKDDIIHKGTVRSGERISSLFFGFNASNLSLIFCSLIKTESIFRDFPLNIVSLLFE